MAALEERNEVLVRCIRRSGLEAIRPLVQVPQEWRRIEGPCILGTFHVGALHAVGAALEALGKPVLGVREGRLFEPRPPLELISTHPQRAAVMLRAVEYLRADRFVVLALDGAADTMLETTCLGHRLALARGAFALSHMTGAPIVPLVMRWRGTDLELVLGQRLQGATEEQLAHAAARWLESYLEQQPQELTLGLLRKLLYAEPRPTS
jgi:lauroyl/myristoyl acyltransferase